MRSLMYIVLSGLGCGKFGAPLNNPTLSDRFSAECIAPPDIDSTDVKIEAFSGFSRNESGQIEYVNYEATLPDSERHRVRCLVEESCTVTEPLSHSME